MYPVRRLVTVGWLAGGRQVRYVGVECCRTPARGKCGGTVGIAEEDDVCAELLPPRPRQQGWSASDCAAVATTGPAAPLRPRRHSGRPSGARTAVTPRPPWRHGRPGDTRSTSSCRAVHCQAGITVGHEDLRVVKT